MKDIKIKTNPFEFLVLKDIEIHKKINQHSDAVLMGYIDEKLEEEYINMALDEIEVKIELINEEGKSDILFCGMVVDFSITISGGLKLLKIQLKSDTYQMDLKEHTRVFQDSQLMYSTILKQIGATYPNSDFMFINNKEEPIKELIVQYKETDWQFLMRIASKIHTYLIPADTYQGLKCYMGKSGWERSKRVETQEYKIKKEIGEYKAKIVNGLQDITESDETVIIFKEREWYGIGDKVTFLKIPFYIWQIDSKYEGSEMIHTYYCKSERGFQTISIEHPHIQGVSLDAIVKEIKHDLVKVIVLEDENNTKDIQKWFSYSTVYSSIDGTGWYCMPETGDKVRLYFPSSVEEDAYVISAIHLESQEPNERTDPDKKSMKNKYGKEILFTPDSLILTNNDGISISILDKEGIKIESKKSITINADSDIEITSKKDTLTLMASEEVDISQGGTSLLVDDNIHFKGGKLKME